MISSGSTSLDSTHDLAALAKYHQYTRQRGSNRLIYLLSRMLLQPFVMIYLTASREGRDNIPSEGALILANHRSFIDPFLIGTMSSWKQPIQFMAKAELFARPRFGWYLSRLGAFPVRRGESDPDAILTAEHILSRGGSVVMFPEGTRLRSGGLGEPRRGAARIALKTGASIVPVTIMGTDRVRRGVFIRPFHCRAKAHHAIYVSQQQKPSKQQVKLLTDQLWSIILQEWIAMGGSREPGVRTRIYFGRVRRTIRRIRTALAKVPVINHLLA